MNPILKRGQWALEHDRCRKCGTRKEPHKAKGMCEGCYSKMWARERYAEILATETRAQRAERVARRRAYMKQYRTARA